MRFMLVLFFSLALILNAKAALAGEASSPPTVTYKKYLSQVLAYYPSLKKEHAAIEKAVAQKALVASSRVPQFWTAVNADYGDDPVYVFGALLRQNRFTNDDFALGRLNTPAPRMDYSAGVGAQWLLFDFSQTSSRIKTSGLLAESKQFQSEFTRMEAILAASEIYSRLAVTDALLKVLNDVTAAAQEDVAESESLSQKGLALGTDFYLARMTATQLLQMKNETTAQRAALAMVFNVLRGMDPAMPVTVALDFEKQLSLPGSAQEWMAKAVAGRLDVKAMDKILDAQGIEAGREKTSFAPKITAYGNADEHAERIGDSGGGNYMVGIKVKMDIFDPGYGPRVKMAKAEVQRLAADLQEAKDQAARDAAETYYRWQALETNVHLAAKNRDDAEAALRLMIPLYREGRRSISEMLTLRAGLVQAYERWLKLEADRRQSVLNLKFYSGELTPQEAEVIYGQ